MCLCGSISYLLPGTMWWFPSGFRGKGVAYGLNLLEAKILSYSEDKQVVYLEDDSMYLVMSRTLRKDQEEVARSH